MLMRVSFMPSRKESAFLRRKNDERVELMGTPCKIYRAKDGGGKRVDVFGDVGVNTPEVRPINTRVIIEYQKEKSQIGDDKATEYKEFPFEGTFRFVDDVRRLDLVEIPYEYARAAGLVLDFAGVPQEPERTLFTRFKLVNRVTKGINSDLMNKFYLSPTEEVWNG
jgi:hypothetical protein